MKNFWLYGSYALFGASGAWFLDDLGKSMFFFCLGVLAVYLHTTFGD